MEVDIDKIKVDRSKFKDRQGRLITQKLFLEYNYDTDFAIYTFEDDHKEYKGVIYFSLKKVFIELGDPLGYELSKRFLAGWKHWKRLKQNKQIYSHISEWEEELDIAIKANAIMNIIDCSNNDSGFQASRWLAENGWEKRGPGRPSKLEKEERMAKHDRAMEDFEADFERLDTIRVQ